MVLTGSFALPGDRAPLPPSSADMFCLSPVGPTQLRELDASVGASGPHDFAVRCNISRPLAWRSLTGLIDPPCNPIARKTLPRPPHPHPASVTIAIRPSGGVGWREFVEMICPTGEGKYFCRWDWTARNSLIRLKKSVFSRSRSAVAVKPADIGQAVAAKNQGPAVIGAAVVGPRRTIIVAAAIPRRIWQQVERHDRGRTLA